MKIWIELTLFGVNLINMIICAFMSILMANIFWQVLTLLFYQRWAVDIASTPNWINCLTIGLFGVLMYDKPFWKINVK